jgi:hypothetical protein
VKYYLLISLFALINLGSHSYAQEDTTKMTPVKVIVTKNDGAQYIGYLLEDDGREILLDTEEIGKVYMPKHMLKSIKPFDPEAIKSIPNEEQNNTINPVITESPAIDTTETTDEEDPDELYNNFISTKYIQTDNAFPLRKGESFLKVMPVGIEVQLPLTKNWSIGGVTSWVGAPAGIRTKYSVPLKDSAYLAYKIGYGNMLFGSIMDQSIRSGGGFLSAVVTFGDRQNNFSFGAGYAMAHEHYSWMDWDPDTGELTEIDSGTDYYHMGYLSFGMMQQFTERMSFVFDSFAAIGNMGVFVVAAPALRFGPKPRHKFQLGGALGIYDGLFVPIPVPTLSYTYVFQKRKF